MLKLKMMLCVMMLPLVVVGCTSANMKSVREATTASGVDNATSELNMLERDAYSPSQREADHYTKTTGRGRSILMSSADRVAHIDGQLFILVNTRASSGVYFHGKNEQSIYECLLGFYFA